MPSLIKEYLFSQIDANREVNEVFTDVLSLFGGLPAKKATKIKKKNKVFTTYQEKGEELLEFSGQRVVFVLGKFRRARLRQNSRSRRSVGLKKIRYHGGGKGNSKICYQAS